MTHEFMQIVRNLMDARRRGLKAVLASVVALEGSSYRRPGVRMLVLGNGEMTGAVSGGCVEKEILNQSGSVLSRGIPKMITYDGRYRTGCEGKLFILIEPFDPHAEFFEAFESACRHRLPFDLHSYFSRRVGANVHWGTTISFPKFDTFALRMNFREGDSRAKTEILHQQLPARFRLVIFGAEHDAVQLCRIASLLGWDVRVIAGIADPQGIDDFPGAEEVIHAEPGNFQRTFFDARTAAMVMTHHYARDLGFLLALRDTQPSYLGLLGPADRKKRLLRDLTEHDPSLNYEYLKSVKGPAGLDIGAETPQEVALSILSEILAVVRRVQPIPLMDKAGPIH